MHLLNGAKTPDLTPIKLPPLGHSGGASASGPARESVSLPPIEHAGEKSDVPKQIPPFKTIADDLARQTTLPDGDQQVCKGTGRRPNGRAEIRITNTYPPRK